MKSEGHALNKHTFPFVSSGNSECVQLMIDRGAQMEAHDCHYGTPLHVACARKHFDCAKVLLSAGEVVFPLIFFIQPHTWVSLSFHICFDLRPNRPLSFFYSNRGKCQCRQAT